MRDVVIVSGSRTAIGNFGGVFKNLSAVHLGSVVIHDVLERIGLKPHVAKKNYIENENFLNRDSITFADKVNFWDSDAKDIKIDEVIMGNVLQSGQGQNPARQASIKAGIPKETPAFTINKVCGSGLKAISIAASSIMTGENEVVIAGGMENMTLAPMALMDARWGYRMELSGVGKITDLMVFDGLYEIFYGYHMGITAENIAKIYNISRREQDEISVLSHNRAKMAMEKGYFSKEIVSIPLKVKNKEIIIDTDERPMDTNYEKLSKLRPVFKKNGTVTAGNSSGINDGAASVLLMSYEKAKEFGIEPIVKIKAFGSGGLDPAYMGLGPVPAIKSILARTGMNIDDIDMIELNEAFASQTIACIRELGLDHDRVNDLGSGISLGHPIGCTGARQIVTGINQMKRMGYCNGLISMCIGGGMGMAMIVQS